MSRLTLFLLPLLGFTAMAQAAVPEPSGRYLLDVDATMRELEAAGEAKAQTRQTLEQMRNAIIITFAADTVTFAAGGRVSGRCDWALQDMRVTLDRCRTVEGGPYDPGAQIAVDGKDRIILQGGAGAARIVFSRE